VADKWLGETYGTQVVSFVYSIGDVQIDPAGMQHPEGRPWTREEVDREGQLVILRNPANGWRKIPENAIVDPKERALAQKDLDEKDEAVFVQNDQDLETPTYIDAKDRVYNRKGELLIGKSKGDVAEFLTDELVHLRCPHAPSACKMASLIRLVKSENDSIGGTVVCVCSNVPPGIGEPAFDKLEALLAHGVMSLPATKGFAIGSGFEGTSMRGSQHNDAFEKADGDRLLKTKTNNAGGTLGGISSGADIIFRVAVKPVSTIGKAQDTTDFEGIATVLEAKGRHDPCVLPRTPPLVESMTSLVLIDAALLQRTRIDQIGAMTIPSSAKVFEADPSESAKEVAAREAKRRKTE